jgi:hypothetical protein
MNPFEPSTSSLKSQDWIHLNGTQFDRHRRVLSGDMYQVIQVMHERYGTEATLWLLPCQFIRLPLTVHTGPVVRIRPNELSFADADAIKEIYGFSKAHVS